MSELKQLLELLYDLHLEKCLHCLNENDVNVLTQFNEWYRVTTGDRAMLIYDDMAIEKKIASELIIRYLLKNVNGYSKLEKLLREQHRNMHYYIFMLLSDNKIYESADEKLKHHCANILAECIMENYTNMYQIDTRERLREYLLYEYLEFPDSIEISLMITNFLNVLSGIVGFGPSSIDMLLKYSNSKLHPITIGQIRELIFKLLDTSERLYNAIDLYKALISFNVLTEEEMQSIKDKEAKLIMNNLF